MELSAFFVQELDTEEMKIVDGGNWLVFVAGAIVGGIIYDVAKSVATAVYNSPTSQAMINQGMSSPLR